jgi:hypothetical protein
MNIKILSCGVLEQKITNIRFLRRERPHTVLFMFMLKLGDRSPTPTAVGETTTTPQNQKKTQEKRRYNPAHYEELRFWVP